ncbi:carbohydrate ABC transporter permease [Paenibacillus glycanilyticus]|uniref:carbohydrate ABC transporter permease n=1 Tax=Paenibacillus glycanilyticus TaxID=126569 RepID=UPI000FDBE71A|nr:carbohydrate ABC transporter permease [Paenibacillus glycanilyticus]
MNSSIKISTDDRIMRVVIYVLLTLLTIATFYPFWNTVVISFNNGMDTSRGGLSFWPRQFTLDNYEVVMHNHLFFKSLMTTTARVLAGVISSISLTAMFAYAMSKRDLIGKKMYMTMAIITMYFGGGLIPTYLVIKELHLVNTFSVLFIPFTISVFNMIVFRSFFKELPIALEESAKLDGANHFGILFKIYGPLSGPVLAALSLFHAVFLWNDWFYAGIYLTTEKWIPVQTYVMNLVNSNAATAQMAALTGVSSSSAPSSVTSRSLQMATLIAATLPIIIVYPFLQRFFVKGVLIGSVKE